MFVRPGGIDHKSSEAERDGLAFCDFAPKQIWLGVKVKISLFPRAPFRDVIGGGLGSRILTTSTGRGGECLWDAESSASSLNPAVIWGA
jgi:hypothetical protein